LSLWCIGPASFSPQVLNTIRGTAFILPNTFHNPTMTLLKPFAVLAFLGVVAAFSDAPGRRWLPILGVGLMTAAATLTKPNYTMALLPAATLVLAYHFIRPFRLNRWLLIGGILIPAVAVLGWQFLRVYGPAAPVTAYNPTQAAKVVISPLELYVVWWYIPASQLLPAFFLSILFPLSVYAAYFKSARRDLPLNTAWLIFLIGASFAYVFIEIPNQVSGNMTWGGRITLFVLFAASLGFFIRQNASTFFSEKRLPRDWRFYVCVGVYLLHVIPYLLYAHVKPV
jgi:hypothetical protein